MKLKCIFIFLLLILLLPNSSAENSISNFVKIEDFSNYSSSVSSIESKYSFSAKYATTIQLNFELNQNKLIETGEWNITFMINDISKNSNETSPGVFVSDEISTSSGIHTLKIIAIPKPNVIPSTYTYIVTLLSEDVYITPRKKSSGGFYVFPPTPTPTLTPTPISTPSISHTEEPTVTFTSHQIPDFPEEPDFNWKAGILTLLILLILYLLYRNRNHKLFNTLKQKLNTLRR